MAELKVGHRAPEFEPQGAVAAQCGALHQSGVCRRAQFIIHREITVRLKHDLPMQVSPGAQKILGPWRS
ncbi:MAG: hypothetical protein AB7Y46_15745 [Armatimonadota bacterium]